MVSADLVPLVVAVPYLHRHPATCYCFQALSHPQEAYMREPEVDIVVVDAAEALVEVAEDTDTVAAVLAAEAAATVVEHTAAVDTELQE